MRTVIEFVGFGVIATNAHPGTVAPLLANVLVAEDAGFDQMFTMMRLLPDCYTFYGIAGDGVCIFSVDFDDSVEFTPFAGYDDRSKIYECSDFLNRAGNDEFAVNPLS
jgi:hypothetical protein